ncbi:coiled-coil domain-containing protein 152 isoform X3 [Salmo salar]|uniref:Coiled-coil domain-containing protein 152 isoform X3 n=1 Tax=Salmo salar TaxID=8030 RepID=A0A1S3LH44_SALSA|nr:coiled-coil domain-containing protein 152 isoform X3 [Salmo salar]|eukprot:XP_013990258.1 PREDICTED: coiled-coil domain-containing protein 152 isoform X3 [Salmo salar]
MKKCTVVNLDKFIDDFTHLEQKITELKGKNNILEIKLDETNRVLKFSQTKEKCLIEERDGMLGTVNGLQQTLLQQCDLRVENEKLKSTVSDLKRQSDRTVEEREAEIQRLVAEMRAVGERHQKELESLREQCRRGVEGTHRETQSKLEAKDAELKEALERKESDMAEMRRRLRDQERESLVLSLPGCRVPHRGSSSSPRVQVFYLRTSSNGSSSSFRRRRTERLRPCARESRNWRSSTPADSVTPV